MYSQYIYIYLHTFMYVDHTQRKYIYIYIYVHFLDTWPREARRLGRAWLRNVANSHTGPHNHQCYLLTRNYQYWSNSCHSEHDNNSSMAEAPLGRQVNSNTEPKVHKLRPLKRWPALWHTYTRQASPIDFHRVLPMATQFCIMDILQSALRLVNAIRYLKQGENLKSISSAPPNSGPLSDTHTHDNHHLLTFITFCLWRHSSVLWTFCKEHDACSMQQISIQTRLKAISCSTLTQSLNDHSEPHSKPHWEWLHWSCDWGHSVEEGHHLDQYLLSSGLLLFSSTRGGAACCSSCSSSSDPTILSQWGLLYEVADPLRLCCRPAIQPA